MSHTTSPAIGRRSLLKLGLGAGLMLGTAGLTATLSGCSSSAPAGHLAVLRESDLPLLAALYPVVVGPHPAFKEKTDATERAIAQLDYMLHASSPHV